VQVGLKVSISIISKKLQGTDSGESTVWMKAAQQGL
jgi:hypothetical protein